MTTIAAVLFLLLVVAGATAAHCLAWARAEQRRAEILAEMIKQQPVSAEQRRAEILAEMIKQQPVSRRGGPQ